jgi:cell division protein YceG involved in septum cleavage
MIFKEIDNMKDVWDICHYFFSKETGLLLILLIIGISFFFLGVGAIQQALKCQVEHELEEINKRSQEQVQKLKKITSINSHSEKDEISHTSDILDIFRKQRAELEQMDTNMYDIRSIVRFIGMLLLPFISSVFKSAIDGSMITNIIKEELVSKINDIITMILK